MTYFFLIVHLFMVVMFSMLLDKKTRLSKNMAMYFGFLMVGILFGVITIFIGSQDVRHVLNPIGTGVGDWFYNNWDPALKHPEFGEPSIPWIMHYPQTYFFGSVLAYGLLGTLIWLSAALNRIDPTRRLMRSDSDFEAEDDEAEDESESKPEPEPQSEASVE